MFLFLPLNKKNDIAMQSNDTSKALIKAPAVIEKQWGWILNKRGKSFENIWEMRTVNIPSKLNLPPSVKQLDKKSVSSPRKISFDMNQKKNIKINEKTIPEQTLMLFCIYTPHWKFQYNVILNMI